MDIDKRTYYVHRLVLETFAGPCPSGTECLHANGIRTDNRLANLSWDTRSKNSLDKIRHGTMRRGESHHKTTLTADDVRRMRTLAESGGMTQVEMSNAFGVSKGTVNKIINRTRWTHVG